MATSHTTRGLCTLLHDLHLSPTSASLLRPTAIISPSQPRRHTQPPSSGRRHFTTTPRPLNWLQPRSGETKKSRKGRPRVPTGGSIRGTTVVWGDYGLRLRSHDRRISAASLKIGEETIKKRLRGERYRLFHRVAANIGVYTSGNESRMGTGKGTFDYWACRLHVATVVFELKGEVHEEIVRDAFRLAGNKMPGLWEFVKKNDPPVMGITKLGNGVTAESLRRPRRAVEPQIAASEPPTSSITTTSTMP